MGNVLSKNFLIWNNNLEAQIDSFLIIFALASNSIALENEAIWRCNSELNKRRASYSFDNEVQQMLCFVHIGDFRARTIECGNKSLYRTELYNDRGYSILAFRSFDRSAKYCETFLSKNKDFSCPKFAYFEYDFNSSQKKVNTIKFIVPHPKKNKLNHSIDLGAKYASIATSMTNLSAEDIEKRLNDISNQYKIVTQK